MDPNKWYEGMVNPNQIQRKTMVDLMNERADTASHVPLENLHENDGTEKSFKETAMGRSRNKLTDKFFAHRNMELIHATIQDIMWKETGYKISKQPDENLVQAMVYVTNNMYEHDAIPDCTTEQSVKLLNQKLYEFLIPIMKQNLRGHLKYIGHLESQPSRQSANIPRPESTRVFKSDRASF